MDPAEAAVRHDEHVVSGTRLLDDGGDQGVQRIMAVSPLAERPATFARNTAFLRREYAAVPEPDWRAGRRRVLERFATAPAIFRTRLGAAYEVPARDNLAAEISALALAA